MRGASGSIQTTQSESLEVTKAASIGFFAGLKRIKNYERIMKITLCILRTRNVIFIIFSLKWFAAKLTLLKTVIGSCWLHIKPRSHTSGVGRISVPTSALN